VRKKSIRRENLKPRRRRSEKRGGGTTSEGQFAVWESMACSDKGDQRRERNKVKDRKEHRLKIGKRYK